MSLSGIWLLCLSVLLQYGNKTQFKRIKFTCVIKKDGHEDSNCTQELQKHLHRGGQRNAIHFMTSSGVLHYVPSVKQYTTHRNIHTSTKTASFLHHVSLPLHMYKHDPTGQIFIKFHTGDFYDNLPRQPMFRYNQQNYQTLYVKT